MAFEVRVPAVGESVQEGEIYKWHKQNGDYVELDDVLVELETDKATVEIVAEAAGVVSLKKEEGDTVVVGDLLAEIDTSAQKSSSSAAAEDLKASSETQSSTVNEAAASTNNSDSRPQSPAVARMVAEQNIDTSSIAGTGLGGRVTKEDLVNSANATAPAKKVATEAPAIAAPQAVQTPVFGGSRETRREKMSRMRKRTAERLVEAQQTAAMLTTFNEVDMTAVMNLRKKYKEDFKEAHGVGLGFMSFFTKACVEALKAYPAINGFIDNGEIVFHDYCDVGIAVSTPKGLVVPVIRNAETLNFAGVESTVLGLAKKGRDGKLGIDEMTGGTFTITNGGVFGSLLSTPILNTPQSGILGLHKIQQRAVVENGEIVARPMMYLALSYDHRIVDGKEAVGFLVKVKEMIEDPTRLLLGV